MGMSTVPLSTHPDPMHDREDWREYQQALKTVAVAFGTTNEMVRSAPERGKLLIQLLQRR